MKIIDTNSWYNRIRRHLIIKFARYFSDRKYLELLFPLRVGYSLNLDNPQTFNEKLQWLKLYNRRPEFIKMVDKIETKKYVADIIGEKHIIPTLAVYNRVEDIDFDALPNQFVLKCSHDSGGIVVCRDKSKLDRKAAIKKLSKGLKKNYFYQNREWPYKGVKPRILAEKYMVDDGGDLKDYKVLSTHQTSELIDYKFMCYNGTCKNLFVCTGRANNDLRVDFFDIEWNHLPFYRKYKNADVMPLKPTMLNEMIMLSNTLAQKVNAPFVRIDLYQIKEKIYFGEITFYPGSGMEYFKPLRWDRILGDQLSLER